MGPQNGFSSILLFTHLEPVTFSVILRYIRRNFEKEKRPVNAGDRVLIRTCNLSE